MASRSALILVGVAYLQEGTGAPKSKGKFFEQTPKDTKFQASSFASLNLSRPLVKACTELGYTQPTPIQVSRIAPSHQLMASSQRGVFQHGAGVGVL